MDNDPAAGQDPSNIDSNKGILTCRYEPYENPLAEMVIINNVVYQLRKQKYMTKSHAKLPTQK